MTQSTDPVPAPRPTTDDAAYLRKRAADHRDLALRAIDPAIRAIHLQLQKLYEKRAE